MIGRIALLLLVAAGLLPGGKLAAQTPSAESLQPEMRGLLRHSLIDWLHPRFPGAQIGIDYRVGRNRYLRHEAGYLLDLGYHDPAALRRISGLRFRTAYRQYFQSPGWIDYLPYLECSLDYRYLDTGLAGDFWRDDFRFQQRLDYSLWEHAAALAIRGGVCLYIGRRGFIDLGIGAGIRMTYRRYSEIPDDADFITNGSWWLWAPGAGEGRRFEFHVPLVLAVGYRW